MCRGRAGLVRGAVEVVRREKGRKMGDICIGSWLRSSGREKRFSSFILYTRYTMGYTYDAHRGPRHRERDAARARTRTTQRKD